MFFLWLVESAAGESLTMSWNKFTLLFLLLFHPSECSAKSASVSDFWFLRGNWQVRNSYFREVEEKWTKVNDYTLEGRTEFRRNAHKGDNKPTLSEVMQIHTNPNRTFMTIKHFDENMKPWSESDEAGDLELVEIDIRHAVFENSLKDNYVKITYTWLGTDALEARVKTEIKGNPSEYIFDYIKPENLYKYQSEKYSPPPLQSTGGLRYSGGFDLDRPIKPVSKNFGGK